MEEIRKAALAYHDNMGIREMLSASASFKGCSRRFSIDFCKKVDDDKDGFLEFGDFIVFWYLVKNKRLVYCDGCVLKALKVKVGKFQDKVLKVILEQDEMIDVLFGSRREDVTSVEAPSECSLMKFAGLCNT
ncbi:hypothetical protein TIFTF001_034061 [Ficus carica]|uniref:EF-hand domain-containing protein n=1 Tax=Ficus carica TaxID=3494 RepID=A0AA88JA64_FICCA|nr:hypothetical protein TIFTF001_034061 [Ficus carica]